MATPTRVSDVLARPAALVAALVLLLAALAFSWWALRVDRPAGSAPQAQQAAPAASLTAPQARELVTKVESGRPVQLRDAFAIPRERRLDPGFVRGLRALQGFAVDRSSFRAIDARTGTVGVDVTTAAGTTERWTAYLAREDARSPWTIASTARSAS